MIKKIYWLIRNMLGSAPLTHEETLYRLKRHALKHGSNTPGVYKFPWGEVEYVILGQLIHQYSEIYRDRHYAFSPTCSNPAIIDCGGNIGLSALWFLQNYPDCKLSVFEPDANLAGIIRKNLQSAGYDPNICKQKAVWYRDGSIGFDHSGDDSGRISPTSQQSVETIDLAKYLNGNIELLKLDIEGAEFEVIEHLCKMGAINNVNMLTCELHVKRGSELRMIGVMNGLIESGMKITLNNGIVGPCLGSACERSPFVVIGNNQLLIELYAWRT